MDVGKFYDVVKGTKRVTTTTGFFNQGKKLYASSGRTYVRMVDKTVCKCCGHAGSRELVINFFSQSKPLTIFEADLLWAVFVLGKRPADYASYHKCVAGKRFIENIKSIEVKK